jgi:hypothetical protein
MAYQEARLTGGLFSGAVFPGRQIPGKKKPALGWL